MNSTAWGHHRGLTFAQVCLSVGMFIRGHECLSLGLDPPLGYSENGTRVPLMSRTLHGTTLTICFLVWKSRIVLAQSHKTWGPFTLWAFLRPLTLLQNTQIKQLELRQLVCPVVPPMASQLARLCGTIIPPHTLLPIWHISASWRSETSARIQPHRSGPVPPMRSHAPGAATAAKP